MDLRKLILTNNACYKSYQKINVGGIMWHSTGCNNPNLKRYVNPDDGKLGVNPYGNHWNLDKPDGDYKCCHAFIGKDKNGNVCTYQTLPFDINGWHCGGSGNSKYIGFEICEDGLNDKSYFDKVYKEAVEFTAYLCKMFNLNPLDKDVIICHADGAKLGIASGHGDVYHWFNKFGKTMDDVRRDVNVIISGTTSTPSTQKLYRIRKSWDDAKSQIGAYANLESAKSVCKEGYFVFDENGNVVYPIDNKVDNSLPTIRKGDKGSRVKAVQALLIGYGYNLNPYGADGSFGSLTETRVKEYQSKNGLTADGVVGVNTWNKMLGG